MRHEQVEPVGARCAESAAAVDRGLGVSRVIRARRRLSIAAVVAAMVLGVGSVPPALAATTKSLEVVLVTQLTSWSAFPYTETHAGSGVGSDLQVWTFTETVTHYNFLGHGTFSMQAGADGLAGTVNKYPNVIPVLGYDLETWRYTVTDGQGAYAGCTGYGTAARRRVTPPLMPTSEVVVQGIAFDLTCP